MLSQWRAYGNDGVGIAIGFDYDLFKKILKPENKFFIDNVIGFIQITQTYCFIFYNLCKSI